MRAFTLKPSTLKGTLTVPSSKSQTLRAMLFGALGFGETLIHSPLKSPDTDCMVRACRSLGAKVEWQGGSLVINGVNGAIQEVKSPIDVGNSGILLRFLSAIASLGSEPVEITGDHSICTQRPLLPLIEGLKARNVQVHSNNGFAPVTIRGPFSPGLAEISGEDSQPVSAMLIAMAFAKGASELVVHNAGEKPWVALTLDWFDRLGIPYQADGFERFQMSGSSTFCGFQYSVPGDWSSAAFPLAAALVTCSELQIENLDLNEKQGDKRIVEILQKMGAQIKVEMNTLYVGKHKRLQGIEVDINDCIDTVTILAVLACFAEGETRIGNAKVAKTKECNRLKCIAEELRKMGGEVEVTEDGLIIQGRPLKGAHVHSHGDHRMALSLAVAALGATGSTRVEGCECVAKTYGTFFEDLKKVGAVIK